MYPADEYTEGMRLFMFWMEDCFDPICHVVVADSFEDAHETLIEDWMPKAIRHYLVDPDDEDYKEAISEAKEGACSHVRWTNHGWLDTEALQGREIIMIGKLSEVSHG
jgi:hypothetical protein